MNKRRFSILLAILIVFSYIFLFSPQIGKERIFNPVWSRTVHANMQVQQPPEEPESEEGALRRIVHFHSGSLFGYITTAGEILFVDTLLYHAALSDTMFINCSNIPSNLVARDTGGRIAFSIETSGYPVFFRNRFFVISPHRNKLAEYDDSGSLLWERSFISPITCWDVQRNNLVVGLLNGSVMVIDKDGENIFTFTPTGSEQQIVYGCTLSSDEKTLALITGLHPQRIILLQRRDKEFKPVYTKILEKEYRRTVYMYLEKEKQILYFEGEEGVHYLDIDTKQLQSLPVMGRLVKVAVNDIFDFDFLSIQNGEEAHIIIFDPVQGRVIRRFTVPGKPYVRSLEKSLFLGFEGNVMRLDILEQ
jgi:hypothetical protein